MPFAPHIRLSALGRLGATSGEYFSYSLNMGSYQAPPAIFSPTVAIWEDMAADFVTFHSSAGAAINPLAILTHVKVASIGADGKYTADPVIIDVADTPGGGSNNPNVVPQAALAISLGTARRGPTGKGRFYMPMPTMGLEPGTMTIPDATRDAVQAVAAQLVADLGNQPDLDVLDYRVVVASSKGYNTEVTGVRVGRVIDTIRSRRRSLPEAFDPYTAVAQS